MKFEEALPYLRQGRNLSLTDGKKQGLIITSEGLYQITAKDILEGDFEVLAKEELVKAWIDLASLDILKKGRGIVLLPDPKENFWPITFSVVLPSIR